MVALVCETATKHVAALAYGRPYDADRLADLLRAEVESGYNGLVDEIGQASRAFHGNLTKISRALDGACMGFATRAWNRYTHENKGA